MIFKNYNELFNNQFSPHPDTLFIQWNIVNKDLEEKKEIVSEKNTEKIPISETTIVEEKKEDEKKEIVSVPNTVSYEIKDITPKKHFWRK